ncbi:MAG TPA: gamma-glutamylcyclotransferase, partial [Methylobacterium sp.]|nr:gamma-glutamylcyclotransferase [Methylobacterium sp.]
PDLPTHWARLDAFEGAGYRRALTRVQTAQHTVEAWIYVVSEPVEGERRVGPASGGTSERPAARVPAATRHPS